MAKAEVAGVVSGAGTFRPMLALALPVLAEQLLNVLVAFVDTYLAGNVLQDDAYMAAIGLMSYSLWLIPSLFAAVAIGATALVARFVGAGDVPLASRVANQAFLMGTVLTVFVTAAVFFLGDDFVRAMQLTGLAQEAGIRYLMIIAPVVPAIMLQQVGIACLRGAGDTVSGLIAMTVVNAVNIVVSYVLATGWGPFPALGWEGLAIGTAVSYVVGAVIILSLLVAGRAGLVVRMQSLRPDPDLIRRLLNIGWPGGADMLAVLGCHLWFLSIINALGTAEAAAHSLGIRIESLAYLPGTAFQVAAATLAGQYLGAGDKARAVRSVWLCSLVGGGLMMMAGLVFYFGAETLTGFFLSSDDSTARDLAVPLLRLVSFAMPSLAVAIIVTGALRGAGDTRLPLIVNFIGFLAVRIPGAYFLAWDSVSLPLIDITLPGLGLGVIGAWYAMVGDIILRSMLTLARFWQGGWTRVKV